MKRYFPVKHRKMYSEKNNVNVNRIINWAFAVLLKTTQQIQLILLLLLLLIQIIVTHVCCILYHCSIVTSNAMGVFVCGAYKSTHTLRTYLVTTYSYIITVVWWSSSVKQGRRNSISIQHQSLYIWMGIKYHLFL